MHQTDTTPTPARSPLRSTAPMALALAASLFFDTAALAPGQGDAVEQLLGGAQLTVAGNASSCCVITPQDA